MNWVESIKRFSAYDEQEKKDQEIALKCIELFDDILTRDNDMIHVTSSGFVVNKERNKTLMVHHNIYQSWSWTGGHADGEKNLLHVAMKEVKEETGVKTILPISSEIISLDVLPVSSHLKNGKYIAPHLHISIAYLLEADEQETLIVKPDENSNVQWVPLDQIDVYSNEPHMIQVYKKVIEKIKALEF